MTICRICLHPGTNMKPFANYMTILERIIGKEIMLSEMNNWLCYKCLHLLEQYSHFQSICLKTEMIWEKCYTNFLYNSPLDSAILKQRDDLCTNRELSVLKTLTKCNIMHRGRNQHISFINGDNGTSYDGNLEMDLFYPKDKLKLEIRSVNTTQPVLSEVESLLNKAYFSDESNVTSVKKDDTGKEMVYKKSKTRGNRVIEEESNSTKENCFVSDSIFADFKIEGFSDTEHSFDIASDLSEHLDDENLSLKTISRLRKRKKFSKSTKKNVFSGVEDFAENKYCDLKDNPSINSVEGVEDSIMSGSNVQLRKYRKKLKLSRKKKLKYKESEHVKSYRKFTSTEGILVRLSRREVIEELEVKRNEDRFLLAKNKCEACAIIFKGTNPYKKHMLQHLETSGDEVCGICSRRYRDPACLLKHMKWHSMRVDCQICGKRLLSVIFHRHLAEHKGNSGPNYACDQCPKTFQKRVSLSFHQRNYHIAPENYHRCDKCPKVLKHKFMLIKHKACHAPNPKYRCDECGRVFVSESCYLSHKQMHLDRRDNYCVECNMHFKTKSNLKLHFDKSAKHINPQILKYKCEKCPKSFQTEKEVLRHTENFHEGVKRYTCEKCSKGYATITGLRLHIRKAHQGYKFPLKHECPHCSKKFATKTLMNCHIRTHTGEQPFECEFCQRKFSQSSSMRTHIKLVHKKVKNAT